jgi:hypothetical protein
MWKRTRQALLRPEYQDWYPWVTPGVWYRAAWLTEIVLRQRQTSEPRWEAEARIPNDKHFVFRGGRTSPARAHRTRWADRPGRALRIPRPSQPVRVEETHLRM